MTTNNNSPAKILVVEDDENLRLAVSDNLEDQGYDVVSTGTGAKATDYVQRYEFDLIVLDIMLPDNDGFTLCRQWRESKVQSMILMLTAKDREDDMVQGFSAGADDYIVKPYQLRVFLSRVAALLRRRTSTTPTLNSATATRLPGYHINYEARTVSNDSDHTVELTKIEYDLLLYFLENVNCALTYDDILHSVWGENIIVVQGAVRNTISSLRKKLNASTMSSWRIVTLRGVGYRFEVDE
ncbi:MAG: response regulator transcription factor [Gammaproteobacteria bacterium]|nr:response regulator transcription factor [Gammaproteobacteria bacterium]MDH5802046.1 response regulator transcription factor [Gammaproteobacteria bacterium]